MKAAKSIQVVIVGAGIGGLGTAITLQKAGHKVLVLEQASEFIEVCDNLSILTSRSDIYRVGSNIHPLLDRLERESRCHQMPLES